MKIKQFLKKAWALVNNENGFLWAPAIVGGASIIAGLLNKGKGSGASDAARQAIAAVQGVNIPDTEKMKYIVENLIQQGLMTPEDAQAVMADPSAFEQIKQDPTYKQAQLDALSGLQRVAKEGGITPEQKAQMEQIQSELGTSLRGEREAVSQNAMERGVGGSGLELASKLGAGQAATTAASRGAVDMAAQAREQALAAMAQSGQLAGQMGGQEFAQNAQVAAAKDAITKFNAQNKQAINLQNTEQRNLATAQNLQEKQRVSDANAAMKNEQSQYNATLPQLDYENRMKKAAALAGQYGKMADIETEKKKAKDTFAGGLIGAGGTTLASAWSDERLKEDIQPADNELDGFMDHLTPKRFKFKDKAKGEGRQYGVIAQHLEKHPVGKSMIGDTPEGKIIMGDKALGVILASLGRLHEKMGGK